MPNKGQVFCISEGIYSDYGLAGHFTALEDFSMKQVSRDYLNSDPGLRDVMEYYDRSSRPLRRLEKPVLIRQEPEEHTTDGFQAYLIRQRLVEPFDVREYWVGDYKFSEIKED